MKQLKLFARTKIFVRFLNLYEWFCYTYIVELAILAQASLPLPQLTRNRCRYVINRLFAGCGDTCPPLFTTVNVKNSTEVQFNNSFHYDNKKIHSSNTFLITMDSETHLRGFDSELGADIFTFL